MCEIWKRNMHKVKQLTGNFLFEDTEYTTQGGIAVISSFKIWDELQRRRPHHHAAFIKRLNLKQECQHVLDMYKSTNTSRQLQSQTSCHFYFDYIKSIKCSTHRVLFSNLQLETWRQSMGEEFLDVSWGYCVVLPSMSFRMACLR